MLEKRPLTFPRLRSQEPGINRLENINFLTPLHDL